MAVAVTLACDDPLGQGPPTDDPDTEGPATDAPVPASVEIVGTAPAYARVEVGAETGLSAIVRDTAGAVIVDAVVAWSSSTPGIVAVDSAGVLRGPDSYEACNWVRPGQCTAMIVARSGPAEDDIAAIVLPEPAIFHMEPEDTTIRVGEAYRLQGHATSEGRTVGWCHPGGYVAADPAIAHIDFSTGRVEGRAPGTTSIEVGNMGTYCSGFVPPDVSVTVVKP